MKEENRAFRVNEFEQLWSAEQLFIGLAGLCMSGRKTRS